MRCQSNRATTAQFFCKGQPDRGSTTHTLTNNPEEPLLESSTTTNTTNSQSCGSCGGRGGVLSPGLTSANENASGSGWTCAASISAIAACDPDSALVVYTRSPGLTVVTASPTASTMPAASLPGVYGSGGLTEWLPDRMYVSTGLTPNALTRTSTCGRWNIAVAPVQRHKNNAGVCARRPL